MEYINYFDKDEIGWYKKIVGSCIVDEKGEQKSWVILLALEISKPNGVVTCQWLNRSSEAFHFFELLVGSVTFLLLRAVRLINLPLLHSLFGRMPFNI